MGLPTPICKKKPCAKFCPLLLSSASDGNNKIIAIKNKIWASSLLLLPTVYCYCLLFIAIAHCYCLLLIAIAYSYCLLLIAIAYCLLLLPTVIAYCLLLLPTAIAYCLLLLPTDYCYCILLLLLPTPICKKWPCAKFCPLFLSGASDGNNK